MQTCCKVRISGTPDARFIPLPSGVIEPVNSQPSEWKVLGEGMAAGPKVHFEK